MYAQKYWSMSSSDVLDQLDGSERGLSKKQASERLVRYGTNEISKRKVRTGLFIFLSQFENPLVIILIGASIVTAFLGELRDATIITVIVIINGLLGFFQEYRSEKTLERLRKYITFTAKVMREGDRISADARLIEAISLRTNEASLTGESMPVSKQTLRLSEDTPILDRKNMVFSGTEVTSGKGKALVVATGMNTEFGKIAKQVTVVVKEETTLEKRTKELGKWLGIVALSVSVSTIILGIFRGMPLIGVILFGIALAVAAVPEALPAVVTGSLAIDVYKMAKRNAIVRKMPAVETLGSTTVICSDKTGTLTRGEMTVRKIYSGDNMINVTGTGYEPKGEFHTEGDSNILQSERFSLLMKGSLLCNDAELTVEEDKWHIRGDPTEGALVVVAAKAGFQQTEVTNQYPRVGELPFSPERKRMTTVHLTPYGDQIVYMKGAPETILERCGYVQKLDKMERLTDTEKKEILKINEEMAREALRVLGVAHKKIPASITNFDEETLEKDLIFLGLIGMMDPPREEATIAVEACKKVKLKPIMITGDHKLTAMAIAKEMGIYQEGDIVLTGENLEKMTDEEIEEIVERVTVYARVSPAHKLKIVEAWKKKGQVVAMTGDGVNDAPALKHADIGVAMGITGTEVTKEAADLVLADDNFATIVNAIELGRWIYDNIKKYLTYLLQANLVEIVVLSIAVIAGYPLPLLPIQILYINLATDGLPAIALGVSPSDPDVMRRPPRPPEETVFTKEVKSFLLRAALIEVPLLLWVFLSSLPQGVEMAQTRLFLVLVFFELILALNCRSLKYTLFEVRPHKFLLLAVIWEALLILTLINIPVARQAFGISSFGLFEANLIAGLCLITLLSVEITKRLFTNIKNKKDKGH